MQQSALLRHKPPEEFGGADVGEFARDDVAPEGHVGERRRQTVKRGGPARFRSDEHEKVFFYLALEAAEGIDDAWGQRERYDAGDRS